MLDFIGCLAEVFAVFIVAWLASFVVLTTAAELTGSRALASAARFVEDIGSRPGDLMAVVLEFFVAAVAVMALGIIALVPAVLAAFLVDAIRRA